MMINRLGSSSESSFWICGSEVTERWIHIENNNSITGLLCECISDVPITRWTVEIRLTGDASGASNAKAIKFDCPTNICREEGAETVNIDSEGGKLDGISYTYFTAIYLDQCKLVPCMTERDKLG
ncbi:hypothetical protein ACTXT7_015560 [Hymenolepis weldensis]